MLRIPAIISRIPTNRALPTPRMYFPLGQLMRYRTNGAIVSPETGMSRTGRSVAGDDPRPSVIALRRGLPGRALLFSHDSGPRARRRRRRDGSRRCQAAHLAGGRADVAGLVAHRPGRRRRIDRGRATAARSHRGSALAAEAAGPRLRGGRDRRAGDWCGAPEPGRLGAAPGLL